MPSLAQFSSCYFAFPCSPLSPSPSLFQTVARASGVSHKHSHGMSSFSAHMPALAEETTTENERGMEKEVGIDCPPEFKV